MVLESNSDGPSRNTYYALNDDDRPYSLTPEFSAEWQRVMAMQPGPDRVARAKHGMPNIQGGSSIEAILDVGEINL